MNAFIFLFVMVVVIFVVVVIIKGLSGGSAESGTSSSAEVNNSTPDGFKGTVNGVDYVVDYYCSDETATIEIDCGKISPLEINAREGRSAEIDDPRVNDINALLDLGANYLDIGYNTNRVAAEIPPGSEKIRKEFAEEIVEILIRLRS